MVDINLEQHIAASLRGAVENYLQTADLNQIIADTLQKQINNVVVNLTGKIYNDLISKRDLTAEVTQLVQGILRDQLLDVGTKKVTELLQEPDMARTITTSVQNEVHRVAGSYNFPDKSIPFSSIKMDGCEFNAAWINNGIYNKFVSTGITDSASQTQLRLAQGRTSWLRTAGSRHPRQTGSQPRLGAYVRDVASADARCLKRFCRTSHG